MNAKTLALSASASSEDFSQKTLTLGGMPFGVKLNSNGVLIVGFNDITVSGKAVCPAKDAGLAEGDIIVRIGEHAANSSGIVTHEIENSRGNSLTVKFLRDGKEMRAEITPRLSDSDGKYKAGFWIKDSAAGIGTVTYIDEESGVFGGLGHGICDSDTGELFPFLSGKIMDVRITGIKKSEIGSPGEIHGTFLPGERGTVIGNTSFGVFGKTDSLSAFGSNEKMEVGKMSEISTGKAYILCNAIKGETQKYEIEISKINRNANDGKDFVIKVTDKDLIEICGGIVQGMSGSPILQNGKIIGAVTHVLIGDPQMGYGIYIGNMLNAQKAVTENANESM
ncbi:MAG: SpoIVB peptidase [Clostridia bacterium]|nr:SpoIVB peptidase [Clostridia bacterium]